MNKPGSLDQHGDAITEYLGEGASIGGPFVLLDLRYDQAEDNNILFACQIRLSEINRHLRSRTPEADEVRLAVHAAASQLLDKRLRSELSKRWPEGSGRILNISHTPDAWAVNSFDRIDSELLNKARWMVGASGGWNNKSRKRLGFFARVHQVPAAMLIQGLLGHQSDHIDPSSAQDKGFLGYTKPVHDLPVALPWYFFPLAYALMGLILTSTGWIKYTQSPSETEQVSEHHQLEQIQPSSSNQPIRVSSRSDDLRQHYSAIIHELKSFESSLVTDEQQARDFSALGQRLCVQWAEFPSSDLESCVNIAHKTLANILNEDLFMLASSFLTGTEQDEPPSAGKYVLRKILFGKLIITPEYGKTRAYSDANLRISLESTLVELSELSKDDPSWWNWFNSQLQAKTVSEWGIAEGMWLRACRARLLDGPSSDEWEACARIFVQGVNWGDETDAKLWYMAQVNDQSVSAERLAALSQAVALYSSAGGIDTRLVLDPDANIGDRELYLQELRKRWGSIQSDATRDKLVQHLRTIIEITDGSMGRTQVLNRMIELARVNTACWVYERGDEALVGILERNLSDQVDLSAPGKPIYSPVSNRIDDQWAEDSRNIDDPERLLELLRDLDRNGIVPPKSAHALVRLAMQAPDLGVRDFAERVLLAHRDEINVLVALDRVAGDDRMSRRMRSLIQTALNAQENDTNLRQRLLEQMLTLGVFARGNSDRDYAAYSNEYHKLLSLRLNSVDGIRTRDVYAHMLNSVAEHEYALPVTTESALRVGLKRSNGALQRDVIYMNAVLELFALHLQEQFGSTNSQLERILQEHSVRFITANSAFDQLMHIERAFAKLWLLKIERESFS